MMFKLLEDSYLNVLMVLMVSLIPLFTLGFLGMDNVLWITSGVGCILLLLGIARLAYCIRKKEGDISVPVTRIITTYYSVPYSFLLSFLILRVKDVHVEFLLWFSILYFIFSSPIVIKEFQHYSKR